MTLAALSIAEITDDEGLATALEVIRAAFGPVAEQFGFTRENFSGHASFWTAREVLQARDRGIRLYGLSVGGSLRGCVSLRSGIVEGALEVKRLAVRPEFRRHGYGRALLDFAAEQARAAGDSHLLLSILAEHFALQRWYERSGFSSVELRDYDELPVTVRVMRCDI